MCIYVLDSQLLPTWRPLNIFFLVSTFSRGWRERAVGEGPGQLAGGLARPLMLWSR